MVIKSILVSSLAPFENHIANGGEKLLGNASSIKRRPDGRVYVSGQMQRHVLFSAMDRLNSADPDRGKTFISNGDGTTNQIEFDLRSDMGGFMHPSKGDYSGRRIAPLSVTPAVALNESEIGRDLLVRIKQDTNEGARDQALATKEFSQSDLMHMNFFLDISALGISKLFKYENSFSLGVEYAKHTTEDERKRRAELFLNSTRYMNDYASQARNAVNGEPHKVLIVFDTIFSRKASRYFVANNQEQKNLENEIKKRNAIMIIGDDTTKDSVAMAYEEAVKYLRENELFDPTDDAEPKTFAETFGEKKTASKKAK